MLIIFIVLFNKYISIKDMLHFRTILSLIRRIIGTSYSYLIGYFFLLAVFGQIDIFMLKFLSSDHELATYGTAFRYYTAVILVLNSIHTVVLPLVQRAQTKQELNHIYKRHFQMLMLLIPTILLGAVLAPWLI